MTPSHHTEYGFRNLVPTGGREPLLSWPWQRGDPRRSRARPLRPDVSFLRDNRTQPTLTWLGHATFLLQLGGLNILTDPHFSRRAGPLALGGAKRVVRPPLALAQLPHIHAVVISHNHYDHLDRVSTEVLSRQRVSPPFFFVPLGVRAWVRERGYAKCYELDWWQWIQYSGLTFHFVPSQHGSGRTYWSRNRTLWGGWVVDHPSFRFYFAGDSGYGPHFQEIGRRFSPIDLAALPIGGYEPAEVMQPFHLSPEEAILAHADLGARHSVGMCWGTFPRSRESMHEPPQRLTRARQAQGMREREFFLMQQGETRSLDLLVQRQADPPNASWQPPSARRGGPNGSLPILNPS